MNNSDKIILDLCGGTGSWSRPYVEADYDVRLITLPEQDVRTYQPPRNVYGILIAIPCTHFCGSGARWWKGFDTSGKTAESLEIFDTCMRIRNACNPAFWCLENPVGRLQKLRPGLGKPVMYFNPCDYGDPYTKKTCLWGDFNRLMPHPVDCVGKNPIHFMPPSDNRAMLRSITPPGFARAFFLANQ